MSYPHDIHKHPIKSGAKSSWDLGPMMPSSLLAAAMMFNFLNHCLTAVAGLQAQAVSLNCWAKHFWWNIWPENPWDFHETLNLFIKKKVQIPAMPVLFRETQPLPRSRAQPHAIPCLRPGPRQGSSANCQFLSKYPGSYGRTHPVHGDMVHGFRSPYDLTKIPRSLHVPEDICGQCVGYSHQSPSWPVNFHHFWNRKM